MTKNVIFLMLRHECLLIRAETPLKDRYTLIGRSNTLIEQSDHLSTETRMSITMGNRNKKRIIKEFFGKFWKELIIGKILSIIGSSLLSASI